MKVPIEVSARHIHLSEKDMFLLFGNNYKLKIKKYLSQPGQFASEERLTIKGSKGEIEGVIVLGPCRKKTQVEVSLTDCIKLGIKGEIRESGDLDSTPGCILKSSKGEVILESGVIVAKRHIHMNVEDAKLLGIKDGKLGKVKVRSKFRSLVFEDVVLRVDKTFKLAMHIDTDEANAAGYTSGLLGYLSV